MKNTRLYKAFVKFIEPLKPMTGKQRLEHIWEYYKPHMFIALMILMVLVVIISSVINAQKKAVFSGALVNISVTDAGWDYINDSYFERIGGVKGKEYINTTSTYFDSLFTSAATFDMNYNSFASIVSMVTAKSLDYLLMDHESLNICMTQDIMMDLSEFFTEEEFQSFGDRIIYLEILDEDGEFVSRTPVALDVKDMLFVKDCVELKDGCYFAVAANTPHLETCRDFWEYLKAWGQD